MPEIDASKSYPMLSPSHWWTLRKKFRQSIPGVISVSYLGTVLNMADGSARANVLPFLKTFGLVDKDAKPTDRVKLWRDDDSYAAVCQAILKDVYPDDLLSAIDDPKSDRARAEKWFANKGGVGEAASRRMAAIYFTLLEADPTGQPDVDRKSAPPKGPSQRSDASVKKATAQSSLKSKKPSVQDNEEEKPKDQRRGNGPEVNINLQVHISADASPDQIDQIFASMSKHLYQNG